VRPWRRRTRNVVRSAARAATTGRWSTGSPRAVRCAEIGAGSFSSSRCEPIGRRCSRHGHERGLDRTGHAETRPPRMAGLAALSRGNPREQLGDLSGHRGRCLAPAPARSCAIRIAAFRRAVLGRRAGCRARPGRPARLARAETTPPHTKGDPPGHQESPRVGGVTQERTLRLTFPSESRHHRAPLHTLATLHRGLDRHARRRRSARRRTTRAGVAGPRR